MVELGTGLLFNRDYSVWDYRAVPGNFCGQICPRFTLLWIPLAAAAGWTSIHWLHRIRQPTLLMAGADDPLIPLVNARLMQRLIPHSELAVFNCGHLFLLTRTEASCSRIREFLDRP